MPRLAWLVGVFDRRAVHQMLAAASARYRGPEIVEHVAVEAEALAGLEADGPHPHAVAFRDELAAHAAVVVLRLALELLLQCLRPLGLLAACGGLVGHG